MSKVKIGVVGAGVFGGYHAAKFVENQSSDLIYVFDIMPDRAELLAAATGATPADSYDELIAAVDAVVVAAPASEHYLLAKRALEAGRHVFVEKPIATLASQARELVILAETKNVVLQVGHQERYVCESVGLLPAREKVVRIDCVRAAPNAIRCDDVSAIFDLMVHDIDIVRRVTNAEIVNLSASGDYDRAEAELLLDNGVVVTFLADRRSGESERTIEITYESGVQKFDFIERKFLTATVNGVAPDNACGDPLRHGDGLFVDAILSGVKPQVTGKQALGVVEWAEQIENAAAIVFIETPGEALQTAQA